MHERLLAVNGHNALIEKMEVIFLKVIAVLEATPKGITYGKHLKNYWRLSFFGMVY